MGGFLFGPSITPEITLLANPTTNLFVKELKNTKLNKDIFVDAGIYVICKMIKKWILSITGSGITLTNNEIKYIVKAIKSLENRGISLLVKNEDFSIFLGH